MSTKKKYILILWALMPVLIFLSFNYHSKAEYNSYKHVIWADQAGYYVYLPLSFIYNFNGELLPQDITEITGNGFELSENGKVVTKYNYGVALLQSPFFVAAHIFAANSNYKADGFSAPYHWAIMIAAIFYCLAGLHLLYLFLINYVNFYVSFLSVLIILLSTNLYYYTVGQAGMSHVYSFFLFGGIIYLTDLYLRKRNPRAFNLLILCFSLALVIRPTAILLLLFLLMYNPLNVSFKKRWDIVLKPAQHIGFILMLILIVLIPQLLYWKYTHGNIAHYSYENEGFSNWASPKILSVLFSANNGWFIYTPLAILLLIFLFTQQRNPIKTPSIIILLSSIYLFSSWWIWYFGCSFGARNFVEYYPLLCMPFAIHLNKIFTTHQKITHKAIWTSVIAICIYVNIKLVYSFDTCYLGEDWVYTSIINNLLN